MAGADLTRTGSRGFTLIEIMISMMLLLAVCSLLLSGLAGALRQYQRAAERWESTIQLWNRTERLRAGLTVEPGDGGECRPLCRTWLENPLRPGSPAWEVEYEIR